MAIIAYTSTPAPPTGTFSRATPSGSTICQSRPRIPKRTPAQLLFTAAIKTLSYYWQVGLAGWEKISWTEHRNETTTARPAKDGAARNSWQAFAATFMHTAWGYGGDIHQTDWGPRLITASADNYDPEAGTIDITLLFDNPVWWPSNHVVGIFDCRRPYALPLPKHRTTRHIYTFTDFVPDQDTYSATILAKSAYLYTVPPVPYLAIEWNGYEGLRLTRFDWTPDP